MKLFIIVAVAYPSADPEVIGAFPESKEKEARDYFIDMQHEYDAGTVTWSEIDAPGLQENTPGAIITA